MTSSSEPIYPSDNPIQPPLPDHSSLTPKPQPSIKSQKPPTVGKLRDSWSFDLTRKLINLQLGKCRHEFSKFSSNDNQRTSVWEQISVDLGSQHTGQKAGKKFREMMSQYTSKKQAGNRSGEGASSWIYIPIFDADTGGELEEYPLGKVEVGGCLPASLLSGLEEEDRMDMTSDILDTDNVLTPRPVKKVNAAVARKTKSEDLQIMALDKYIVSLDDKRAEEKRRSCPGCSNEVSTRYR